MDSIVKPFSMKKYVDNPIFMVIGPPMFVLSKSHILHTKSTSIFIYIDYYPQRLEALRLGRYVITIDSIVKLKLLLRRRSCISYKFYLPQQIKVVRM